MKFCTQKIARESAVPLSSVCHHLSCLPLTILFIAFVREQIFKSGQDNLMPNGGHVNGRKVLVYTNLFRADCGNKYLQCI